MLGCDYTKTFDNNAWYATDTACISSYTVSIVMDKACHRLNKCEMLSKLRNPSRAFRVGISSHIKCYK